MSRQRDEGISGLVIIDKEPGWTSHDVVARCRRIFGQRRVGHAGTLDPDATGVLLVGLGRATRLMRFLTALEKHYVGELVLGATTSTLDSSGEILAEFDMTGVTLDDVETAARGFVGPILQIPPMVSAVKVGGKRLHELAREGIEIERAARPVTVHALEVSPTEDPLVFTMEVACSSGTYIRTLAADIGTALGGGAHLRNLRRTAIGTFKAEQGRTVDQLAAEADAMPVGMGPPPSVLTPAQAMRDLTQVVVEAEVVTLIGRGLPLDKVSLAASGDGPFALLDVRGTLLAVYEGTETDRIKPSVVLAAS